MTLSNSTTIMALDVGERRIGVAVAGSIARLAQPFKTLDNSPEIFDQIQKLIKDQNVSVLVVGRPRNLSGQVTNQTKLTEEFASKLEKTITIPIYAQDEAVTSRQAEAELKARGKTYSKGEVDSLAATYILEDYLKEHLEISHV